MSASFHFDAELFRGRAESLKLVHPRLRIRIRDAKCGYQGLKATVTDALNGHTVFTFNRAGELTQEKRADNAELNYGYDEAGNDVSYLNGNNKLRRFIFDASHNLVRERVYSGDSEAAPLAKEILYSYNLRGDLLSFSDPDSATTYVRDALGRISSQSVNFGPFTKSHSYTYDANGRVKTYNSPDGVPYEYFYNEAGQFSGLQVGSEGIIRYDSSKLFDSRPKSILLPGGEHQEFEYDSLYRIKRHTGYFRTNDKLLDFTYSYNAASLIDKIQTEHGEYRYAYDEGDRLISSETPDFPKEEYRYDAFGNRYPLDGSEWTYSPLGAPLTAGSTTYDYDTQGNRITDATAGGTTRYLYDELDHLAAVEAGESTPIAAYRYDAFEQRISKDAQGEKTYFYYTPDGLSAEFKSDGSLLRSYVYTPDSPWGTNPLLVRTSEGRGGQPEFEYFYNDHLAAPRATTNRFGAVRWSGRSSAWGDVYEDESAVNSPAEFPQIKQPLRFPGQYADAETGLHYNWHRYYDRGVGGYTQADPLGLLAGTNHFVYAHGMPTAAIDPLGLWDWPAAGRAVRDNAVAYTVGGAVAVLAAPFIAPIVIAGGVGAQVIIVGGGIITGIGVAATAVDVYGSVTGEDYVTGRELSDAERTYKTTSGAINTTGLVLGACAAVKAARSTPKVVIRRTRSGEPGIRLTYRDGSVRDITANRVKEYVPEPRASGGLRQRTFPESLPGSKGKKRLPTPQELDLLNRISGK